MDGDDSARIRLPYLAAAQLQKHVTVNDALTRLDALVQTAVASRTTTGQPTAPPDGSLWILPGDATGSVWSLYAAHDLLRFEAGGWSRVPVADGTLAWVLDEDRFVVRDAGAWVTLGERIGGLQSLSRLGLDATADAANPFLARLNAALWTAKEASGGGTGDLRLALNKETAVDVLSLLFQSGYGGRAELGLIGDDDLRLKVSPDGETWHEALSVDRATGRVGFPRGVVRVEETVLTASGTWTVPTWARRVEALAIGGGGGGGAGSVGSAGTTRYGGGGGGAGGVASTVWSVADLGSSLSIVIGAGGAGGPGGGSTMGTPGDAGSATVISDAGQAVMTALGGAGGAGGSLSSGPGGAGGYGVPASNKGGDSVVGAIPGAGASLMRPDGPGGGGAGGGINTSNTNRTGGAGGDGGVMTMTAAGGAGGTGAAGLPGSPVATSGLSLAGGGGGGGGAASTSGHAGGAGGGYGGGGGGGGAGVTGSGSGGTGATGVARLIAVG